MYTVTYEAKSLRGKMIKTRKRVFDSFEAAVRYARSMVVNGWAVGIPVIDV